MTLWHFASIKFYTFYSIESRRIVFLARPELENLTARITYNSHGVNKVGKLADSFAFLDFVTVISFGRTVSGIEVIEDCIASAGTGEMSWGGGSWYKL